jgi:hypothetical protein
MGSKSFFSCIVLICSIQLYGNPDPAYIDINDSSRKITLTPHGFSTTFPSQDTQNLTWIFANYPTYDIKLVAGTYHVSEMIEAEAYQGSISGTGEDQTFIVGRGPLNADNQYEFPLLNADLTARAYPSGVPYMFWFHARAGNVNNWNQDKVTLGMKDLTIRLDGVGPEVTLFGLPLRSIWGQVLITGADPILDSYTANVSHLDVSFKNVTFLSQKITYTLNNQEKTNGNVGSGFLVFGGEKWVQIPGLNGWNEIDHSPVNANVEVKNCTFKDFHQFGLGVETTYFSNPGTSYNFPTNPKLPKSSVKISNNLFDNVGDGVGLPGALSINILLNVLSETDADVTNNIFSNMPGSCLLLIKGAQFVASIPQLTSNIRILNNTFDTVQTSMSENTIRLFDFDFLNTGNIYNLTIADNSFTGGSGFAKSFCEIGMGANSLIKGNTFTGDAQAAMIIGNSSNPVPPPVLVLPATGCLVKENNFSGLTSSNANVVLGEGSFLNTAIVGSASDVLDNGTSNTIIVN